MSRHLKSKKSLMMIAAACSLLAMTASSRAIDLTSSVFNANMDKSFSAGAGPGYMQLEGGDAFSNTNPAAFPTGGLSTDGWKTWADSSNGTNVRLWNPSTTNRWTRANNEFFDTSWGGNDASGDANGGVIVVRTQGWDYIGSTANLDDSGNRTWTVSTSNAASTVNDVHVAGAFNWQTDSGSVRNFEAATQVISQVFDPTAKYTLAVKVGRLHDDGFNTGATILPGADTVHGTGDDTPGASTRFVNDASVLYNGYFVDLVAGGVQGTVINFGGWTYGRETTSSDAAYMKVLGMENSLVLGPNAWGTSTLNYLPGSLTAQEVADLTGKKLMIRLGANEAPDHKNTTAVAFDDVQLFKFVAGDANQDDLVNGTDLALLAANFGLSGKNWATADFSGDGTVNGTDLALLASNFGFDANNLSLSVGISLEEANSMLQVTAIPEPATWSLLGTMGLAMLFWHRHRNCA